MGKPHLAIRIPPPLLAELNQYVKQTGTSKVVVSAIAQYLGCADNVPLSQRMIASGGQEKSIKLWKIEGYKRQSFKIDTKYSRLP